MRFKEIRNIDKEEREKRLKELKIELVRARLDSSKSGSSKVKNIKRTITQILTLNK